LQRLVVDEDAVEVEQYRSDHFVVTIRGSDKWSEAKVTTRQT